MATPERIQAESTILGMLEGLRALPRLDATAVGRVIGHPLVKNSYHSPRNVDPQSIELDVYFSPGGPFGMVTLFVGELPCGRENATRERFGELRLISSGKYQTWDVVKFENIGGMELLFEPNIRCLGMVTIKYFESR